MPCQIEGLDAGLDRTGSRRCSVQYKPVPGRPMVVRTRPCPNVIQACQPPFRRRIHGTISGHRAVFAEAFASGIGWLFQEPDRRGLYLPAVIDLACGSISSIRFIAARSLCADVR